MSTNEGRNILLSKQHCLILHYDYDNVFNDMCIVLLGVK